VASSEQTAELQRRIQAALGPDYDVQRRIGSGGFAEVWTAFDRRLQRTVAVKVLHPDLVATRAMLERFQREAQAVAKLRHPGVIPIYAVGEYGGLAYYIMPLVEGESLRDRLKREGPLPPEEVWRIMKETAAALALAHKAGLIHRDIKPENLMLEGDEQRVVVLDFGSATSTAGVGAQTGLTGTGMIIGTPTYMSPEQATGSKEVDVRSDVYSLGVVGYELLTGKPPFAAPSVPELIMRHVTTPAPSVASGRADVPESLAIAVNRCLMKEPAERWKDAGELSAFLERMPTPAGGPTPVPKDLRRFAQQHWRPTRRPVIWVTVGIAAILAAAVIGVTPSNLRLSWLYWASRVGLARPRPTATSGGASSVDAWVPPVGWALSIAQVLPMGDSGVAVSHLRNQVWDGRRWTAYSFGPEPTDLGLGLAVPRAEDILLFLGLGPRGGLYRWSWSGISRLDSVPFLVQGAWADRDVVIAFGATGGEVAQWGQTGWQRMATPRRTAIEQAAGVKRNALVALGEFRGSRATDPALNAPDSILEFDGTSWESTDPRPPGVSALWKYDVVAALADGSVAVGGGIQEPGTGDRPLLLIRSAPHKWRQQLLTPDSASALSDITGIWGISPDTMFLWWKDCSDCQLIELRGGTWRAASEMGRGSVLGVVRVRGIIYAVWADGTVWERRGQHWVLATQVPSRAVPFATAGKISWHLENDGTVRRWDCRHNVAPCASGREPFSAVGTLKQLGREAVVAGARGLLAVGDSTGHWKRVALPPAMAAESVIFTYRGGDGDLVAVTARHYAVLDNAGAVVVFDTLESRSQAVGAWHLGDGAVVLGYRDHAVVRRRGATVAQSWYFASRLVDGCELSDGRLVLGLAGDLSDPFSQGELVVYSPDSSFSKLLDLSARLRTSVQQLDCSPMQGDSTTIGVETPSGEMRVRRDRLPFQERVSTLRTPAGR